MEGFTADFGHEQETFDTFESAVAAYGRGGLDDAVIVLEQALVATPGVLEQLMSDIHGDAAAFGHLVRTASGATRAFVAWALTQAGLAHEVDAMCALLAYPETAVGMGLDEGRAAKLESLARRVRRQQTGAFHLLGDAWDRGAHGDDVMDVLMGIDEADIVWGNHDVCWMGAAAGDPVCIATCLRNNIKYGNLEQFQQGYGIDLEPLLAFGKRTYADGEALSPAMKAISSILFKCEGAAVLRHPEWHMDDRLLWAKMDLASGTVPVYGATCQLNTVDFPTFDPADPFALTAEEQDLLDGFVRDFRASERLQAQVQWLYDHGSVYKVDGDLLLVHGCVPLDETGMLAPVTCDDGVMRKGRDLLDWVDALCRRAWEGRRVADLDWMGYLWGGWQATFAGRVVKTFERTYIDDKDTWKEPEDPFYALTREGSAPCELILAEFGLDPRRGVIVNGHTPVKLPKGERPVRGGGRRLVIDGGLCKAYRKSTGIAGYTLVRGADGVAMLLAHSEFPGMDAVLEGLADVTHELAAEIRPLSDGELEGHGAVVATVDVA